MRVLVVGGAGKVGTVIRPALMAEHDLYCFDLHPVPELGEHSIVGDVNDQEAVKAASAGVDAVIYLPMRGYLSSTDQTSAPQDSWSVGDAFDTHVKGFYRFLCEGLAAGASHIVYASTLNVYQPFWGRRLDESIPANGFAPYAVTKRLGEQLCMAGSDHAPEACIIALRLAFPVSQQQLDDIDKSKKRPGWIPLCPMDLGRLFLAALTCKTPGAHILQATGDLTGAQYPNTRATDLLGWKPEGR